MHEVFSLFLILVCMYANIFPTNKLLLPLKKKILCGIVLRRKENFRINSPTSTVTVTFTFHTAPFTARNGGRRKRKKWREKQPKIKPFPSPPILLSPVLAIILCSAHLSFFIHLRKGCYAWRNKPVPGYIIFGVVKLKYVKWNRHGMAPTHSDTCTQHPSISAIFSCTQWKVVTVAEWGHEREKEFCKKEREKQFNSALKPLALITITHVCHSLLSFHMEPAKLLFCLHISLLFLADIKNRGSSIFFLKFYITGKKSGGIYIGLLKK